MHFLACHCDPGTPTLPKRGKFLRTLPRRLAFVLPILALAGLLTAASAWADCLLAEENQIENNQVENCGFEVGDPPAVWIDSWGAGFSRDASTPRSGSYSATIHAESGNISVWGFLLTSNCFATLPGREYRFGGSVRRSVDAGSCNVRLASHGDELCSDSPSRLSSEPLPLVADAWSRAETSGVPAGPFARLEITCTTGSPIAPAFYVDDAFAGPVPAPVDVPTLGSWPRLFLLILVAASGLVMIRAASR